MNWKLRAALLRLLASAPQGDRAYRFLQARSGVQRPPEFIRSRLRMQHRLASLAARQEKSLTTVRVVEVGTGWTPIVPLGWWITGARSVDTYDRNRYYLPEAFRSALRWIVENRQWLTGLYADLLRPEQIREKLAEIESWKLDPGEAMSSAGIRYHAPGDDARTGLAAGSIDIHYSANVLEHIPESALESILKEAHRILRPEGLCIHHIDPSDHYSVTDRTITRINFLRYSQEEWRKYGGNRLAYHNRLRDLDYRRVFQKCRFQLLRHKSQINPGPWKQSSANFPWPRPIAIWIHGTCAAKS